MMAETVIKVCDLGGCDGDWGFTDVRGVSYVFRLPLFLALASCD